MAKGLGSLLKRRPQKKSSLPVLKGNLKESFEFLAKAAKISNKAKAKWRKKQGFYDQGLDYPASSTLSVSNRGKFENVTNYADSTAYLVGTINNFVEKQVEKGRIMTDWMENHRMTEEEATRKGWLVPSAVNSNFCYCNQNAWKANCRAANDL